VISLSLTFTLRSHARDVDNATREIEPRWVCSLDVISLSHATRRRAQYNSGSTQNYWRTIKDRRVKCRPYTLSIPPNIFTATFRSYTRAQAHGSKAWHTDSETPGSRISCRSLSSAPARDPKAGWQSCHPHLPPNALVHVLHVSRTDQGTSARGPPSRSACQGGGGRSGDML